MADYYYTKGGERRGPIPESELVSLIAANTIEPNDYYWTQGMSDWVLVKDANFASSVAEATSAPVEAAPVESSPFEAPVEEVESVVESATEITPTSDATPFETQSPVDDSPFAEPAVTAMTPAAVAQTPASPATAEPTAATSVFGTGSVISEAHTDTVFVKDVANALPKPLWLILPAIVTILIGIPYLIFFFLGAIYIWIGVLLFQTNSGLENARKTGSARELMKALGKINTLFIIVGVMTLISIVLVVLGLIFIIAGANGGNF